MKKFFYENKNSPFVISNDDTLTTQPHLHKELELIYVFNGSATAWADRKSHKLKTGDLFLSFPNQIHYFEGSAQGNYLVIIPNPNIFFGLKDMLYDNIPDYNVVTLGKKCDAVQILERIMKADGEFKDTLTVGLLNQLLSTILPDFTLKPRVKTDNSTLKEILKYCTHNFTENITLDDISEKIHINKYHISHLFNEKLRINFNSYINMLRINYACTLLEDTDKKIADISEESGFGSIRSFNRAFMQVMNTSPIKYKNTIEEQK